MNRHAVCGFFFSIIVLTGISGCGGKQNAAKTTASKVGVSFPSQREKRWVRDKEKMEQVCKEIGLEFSLKVADNDAEKQARQCDSLIADGVNVLIVTPQDARGAASIVEKAHQAGVKVIAYDRMILDADVDLYVSFDNEKVGELQGQFITRAVPQGTYIILAGSPDDNNARLVSQGAMKYLQSLIDNNAIDVIMYHWVKDWLPAEAATIMKEAIATSDNRIDAVLAPNDGIAGACISVLAEHNLAGKVTITGQDAELEAARRIVQGTQSMTVYKNTRKLGAIAVQAALSLATGQPVAMINDSINNGTGNVPSILCEPIAVDKNNLDSVLIDSEYLKKEDVYNK